MTQYLRPDGSVENLSNWTGSYSSIDETSASDGDYITGLGSGNGTAEFGLSNINEPSANTGHTIRFRAWQRNNSFQRTLSVYLYQGATLISSYSGNPITLSKVGAQAYNWTISTGEADNITDYNDLRLYFTSGGDVGAPAKNQSSVYVSWAEMETPDGNPTVSAICNIGMSLDQSFNSNLLILSTITAKANVSDGFSPNLSVNSNLNFGSYNLLNLLSLANVLSEIGIDGRNSNEMTVLLKLISNIELLQNNYLSLIPTHSIDSNVVFSLQSLLNLDSNNVVNSNLSTLLSNYLTLSSDSTRTLLGEISIALKNDNSLDTINLIKSVLGTSLYGILDSTSINLIQSLTSFEAETILNLVSKNLVNAIFENQLHNLINGTSVLSVLSNVDLVTALNGYFVSTGSEPALITASLESLLNMKQSFSSLNEVLGESNLINSLGIIINAINNIKAFSTILNSIEIVLESKKEIYGDNSIQSFLLNNINGNNIEVSNINLSGNLYNVSNALINILSNIEIANEEDLQLNSRLIIGATQLLYGLGIISPVGRSGIFQTVPTPSTRTFYIRKNQNVLMIIDQEGRIFSIPIQNRKLFFPKE